MDITSIFRACVKSVKTKQQLVGDFESGDSAAISSSNGILLRSKQTSNGGSHFERRAREVLSCVIAMKDILKEYSTISKGYLKNLDPMEFSGISITPNAQHLEFEIRRTCTMCQQHVAELHTIAASGKVPQQREHEEAVIRFLELNLIDVNRQMSRMKAALTKKVLDCQKLQKLNCKFARDGNYNGGSTQQSRKNSTDSSSSAELLPPRSSANKETLMQSESESGPEGNSNRVSNRLLSVEETAVDQDETQISSEEAQLFADENNQLHRELSYLMEEMALVETKVVHVAALQETFTDKVLSQEDQIQQVSASAVSSTEFIRSANQDIRKAIQNSAGLRVVILFFLLVMSFSLLFLDWYND